MDRRILWTRRSMIGAAVAGAMMPGAVWSAPPFSSRRISVVTRGGGPDVLLIPGLGTARTVWNGAVAAVPGYRYHLVQVNGFAGTAVGGNVGTGLLDGLTVELNRYIAEAGLVRPAVVGHSMGGMLAMMLALRAPARVGRVMVVDMLPAGAGMVGGTAQGLGALAGQFSNFLTDTPGGRQVLQSMMGNFSPTGERNDPDLVARSLRELAQTDLAPQLGRIRAPMQVVYAQPTDADLRAQIDRSYRAGYAAVRGIRLSPVARSGHMVMLDQPKVFAGLLAGFLRG